ncbi:hypothetical protein RRG08_020157, partial [Elysia crispata]
MTDPGLVQHSVLNTVHLFLCLYPACSLCLVLPRSLCLVLPRSLCLVLPPSLCLVLPRSLCLVLPRSLCLVLPRSLCLVLPRSLCLVLPRSLCLVLPPSLCLVLPRSLCLVLPPSLCEDSSGQAEKDQEAQRLLTRLEDETLAQNIPSTNVFKYEVNWQPNEGISPDSNPTHREYLTKLCEDAEKRLMTLCQRAFTQRARVTTRDPLFQETLQHLTFCQSKCEAFHGRAESLQLIEDYLRGPAQHPFTIHGPSGCGKTSLVAMAAKLCHKIYENKVITIIRLSQILTARATVPYFPHHFVW